MSAGNKNKISRKSINLADFTQSDNILTEAFRMLRLHVDCQIDKNKDSGSGTLVLITSAVQGEGKTTVACNLALACASSGTDTLLIDADLRNPNVHKAFGLDRRPGLADLLLDGKDVNAGKFNSTGHPHLSVLTAGKSLHQSTELLGTPFLEEILNSLKNRFRLIILDSPPLGYVADAGIISTKVNSTYLVVRAGKTNRRTVEKTAQTLRKLGAEISGIILSRCNVRKNRYLYYTDYPAYYTKYAREDGDDIQTR